MWGNGIVEDNSHWKNLDPKLRNFPSICMNFRIPILISEMEMKFQCSFKFKKKQITSCI